HTHARRRHARSSIRERLCPMTLRQGGIGWVGLLAAVVCLAGGRPAPAQTTLRYKFKEGDKLRYAMEQKTNMEMMVAGQNIQMEIGQNVGMTWNVLSVGKDGKAKITQKFDRIRFTMEGGPTGKVEYDSQVGKAPEGPIGEVLGPILKAMAGAEFQATMDPQGRLSDIKAPEK